MDVVMKWEKRGGAAAQLTGIMVNRTASQQIQGLGSVYFL